MELHRLNSNKYYIGFAEKERKADTSRLSASAKYIQVQDKKIELPKTLAFPLPVQSASLVTMYRKQGQPTILPENFELPFEGKLSEDNRWVIMASFIPWSEFEDEYSSSFSMKWGP